MDKTFADGFQVRLHRITGSQTLSRSVSALPGQTVPAGQTAFYLLQGEALVTLDGQQATLYADNTLYCPGSSSYQLIRQGSEPLLLLTITTE